MYEKSETFRVFFDICAFTRQKVNVKTYFLEICRQKNGQTAENNDGKNAENNSGAAYRAGLDRIFNQKMSRQNGRQQDGEYGKIRYFCGAADFFRETRYSAIIFVKR